MSTVIHVVKSAAVIAMHLVRCLLAPSSLAKASTTARVVDVKWPSITLLEEHQALSCLRGIDLQGVYIIGESLIFNIYKIKYRQVV